MIKNKFLFSAFVSILGFISSAEAVKLRVYLHNEDIDPNLESFRSINIQNRNALLSTNEKNDKDKIPTVSEDYDGKSSAYFSAPKKMDKFEEYSWYEASRTKVVLSYEDKNGSGISQSFPFSFQTGFYAYDLNLPEIENKKQIDGQVTFRLESVGVLYPASCVSNQRVILGYTAFSEQVLELYQDEENKDIFHRMAYTKYRQPIGFGSNNLPFTFYFAHNDKDLYDQMKKEGFKQFIEKKYQ